MKNLTKTNNVANLPAPGVQYANSLVTYDSNDIVISDESNLGIMNALRNSSIIDSSKTSLTKAECAAITSLPLLWLNGNSSMSDFTELLYFTGLTTLPQGCLFNGDLQNSNFTNVILPDTIKSFGGTHMFLARTYLRCVVIPEGFTSIPNNTFGNCYRLRYLEFPKTLTSVGNEAFMRVGVAGRQAVTIGSAAFYQAAIDSSENCGCTFVFHSVNPPTIGTGNAWIYDSSFSFMQGRSKVYVPDESVAAYKAANWFSDNADNIYPISTLPYTYEERIRMQYRPDFFKTDINKYLTLETISTNNFTDLTFTIPAEIGTSLVPSISYSTNGGSTWTTVENEDSVQKTITIITGSKVMFKGNAVSLGYNDGSSTYWCKISFSDQAKVYGNIMSLFYGDNFPNRPEFAEGSTYNCYGLFRSTGQTGAAIINASRLVLPATTATAHCYDHMFNGCTLMTKGPKLPATTLNEFCYLAMFNDCTLLTVAPELPAMTMAEQCYSEMFCNTRLTSAPYLPATTLATKCYNFMFGGCYSLTYSPTLPATTMADQCYRGMFASCTHLVTAPEILGTTLAFGCYWSMFLGCTLLTEPPALPVTTLANNCYIAIFLNCTSLTTAPELPAITLAANCYNNMFNGCTALNYIKAMFTTTPSGSYSYNWVKSVASSGTFVKNSAAAWTTTGVHGVPSGWTVETASI